MFCGVVDDTSDELHQLEDAVIKLLSNLLGIEVKIIIVSNGDTSWVTSSLRGLLPRLEQFLTSEKIEVISSRAKYSTIAPNNPAQWKQLCFAEEVMKAKQFFEAQLRNISPTNANPNVQISEETVKNLTQNAVKQHDLLNVSRESSHLLQSQNRLNLPSTKSLANLKEAYTSSTDTLAAQTKVSNEEESKSSPQVVSSQFSGASENAVIDNSSHYHSRSTNPRVIPLPAVLHQHEVIIAQQELLAKEHKRFKKMHRHHDGRVEPTEHTAFHTSEKEAHSHIPNEVSDDSSASDNSEPYDTPECHNKENYSSRTSSSGSGGESSDEVESNCSESCELHVKSMVGTHEAPRSEIDLLVLSIGDGMHERCAVLDVGRNLGTRAVSLKLLEACTPSELVQELQYCTEQIRSVVEIGWVQTKAGIAGDLEGRSECQQLDLMLVRNEWHHPSAITKHSSSAIINVLGVVQSVPYAICEYTDELDEVPDFMQTVHSVEADKPKIESNGVSSDFSEVCLEATGSDSEIEDSSSVESDGSNCEGKTSYFNFNHSKSSNCSL